MALDLVDLSKRMRLKLGPLSGELPQPPASLLEVTRDRLAASEMDEVERGDIAILYLLACIAGDQGLSALPPQVLDPASKWLTTRGKDAALVAAVVADARPADLLALFEQILDAHPEAASFAIAASVLLDQSARERFLTRIASDDREGVRAHLFALLGQHRRLVPPGSLSLPKVGDDVLDEMLRKGMDDPSPNIRERAIALAYGLGRSESLVDTLIERTTDKHGDVRQYALVALGATTGEKSFAILMDRLANGERAEMVSAVWALARRKDGIGYVLARSTTSDAWLVTEISNAIAEVGVSLTDSELESMRTVIGADFERTSKRHIARTRQGAPEIGPDARFTYSSSSRKKSSQ